MKDPLDLFADMPDFPGSRAPKNRPNQKQTYVEMDDRYNGAKGKEYIINGEKKIFFTVGGLAKVLHRKPGTIRMWEQRGWIPVPRYRTPVPRGGHFTGKSPKGRRLYSLDQVEFLLAAIEKFGLRDPHATTNQLKWQEFTEHIKANYPR